VRIPRKSTAVSVRVVAGLAKASFLVEIEAVAAVRGQEQKED
jgi:hypothetical protein